ncbi:MAG: hypothetical protein WCJ61_11635 [Paludibacter sp.]
MEIKKRTKLVERIVKKTEKTLNQEHIPFLKIIGRPKKYFSIFKKINFKGRSIEQVYDLVAMRIVTDTVDNCYQILSVLHKHFEPVENRVKDYIARPKSNGYQSIHTVVRDPQMNFTFEFQNGTYKIACSLDNYEKSSSSNPTIKYWVSIFEGILSFSRYRQVQKPQNKGKGRVSITKQWKPDYYTLSKHQIIENIAGELLEANKIVSKLIELKAQKDKQE